MSASPRQARLRRRTAAAITVAVTLASCSSSPPDPAQARLNRVEKRLRSTFTDAQAKCIVERSDPLVIQALDRTKDLEPGSDAMTAYSDTVATCVAGPASTTTSPGG